MVDATGSWILAGFTLFGDRKPGGKELGACIRSLDRSRFCSDSQTVMASREINLHQR